MAMELEACRVLQQERSEAATHLLLEYWKFRTGVDEVSFDQVYDWINQEGLLSVAEIRAIEHELKRQECARG
jgi:hypothetical protein